MTLTEFIAEQQRTVTNFGTLWIQRHKENPEQFPMVLEPGDWFEQYLAFETNESDEM